MPKKKKDKKINEEVIGKTKMDITASSCPAVLGSRAVVKAIGVTTLENLHVSHASVIGGSWKVCAPFAANVLLKGNGAGKKNLGDKSAMKSLNAARLLFVLRLRRVHSSSLPCTLFQQNQNSPGPLVCGVPDNIIFLLCETRVLVPASFYTVKDARR